MGMFGTGAKAQAGSKVDPSQLSKSDKMVLFGAMLRDMGSGLAGQSGDALANAQSLLLAQQQQARKEAFGQQLSQMLQPQYQDGPAINIQPPSSGILSQTTYTPPVRTSNGLNANSPELPALALQAQNAGYDMSKLMDVFKLQQPDVRYDRGYGYNGKTGAAAGAFHTELQPGMAPTADGGAANVPGYLDAMAAQEGAKARAQEGGKAAFDVITLNQPDGSTVQVPRDVAVKALLENLAGGNQSGLGRSQTPAEASAAKIQGDATANARVELPSGLNTIDTAIETAGRLAQHPALNMRTGGWSMLPAIPGTPGAEFEAYKKQVLGQGWLDARQALKGGGPITDYEGKKAEQAKMRMDAAQTPEAFKSALTDYVGSLQRARAIMQQKAGVAAPAMGRITPEAARAELARRRSARGGQ